MKINGKQLTRYFFFKFSTQTSDSPNTESDDDFFDAVSRLSYSTNKRDSIATFHSLAENSFEVDDEVFENSGTFLILKTLLFPAFCCSQSTTRSPENTPQ